jgi:CP family cyanate transporter-like MFS transporter
LVGINLRTVLLGVPPDLPTLHHTLSLSYSAGGFLTSLPVLLMALGAIPGAYLISRIGPRQAVATGLGVVGAGAALRALAPSALPLFLFTIVLALGIAVCQPAMPGLAQAWFPDRVGRAVAIYSNGLLIGEIIAASLTLPFLLSPLGWQAALAAWSIPVLIMVPIWLLLAPPERPRESAAPIRWLPDWRSGATLRLGFLMGTASLLYFGMNTWIPDTLDARGAHGMIPLTLGSLNVMQLPVSLALTVYGPRLLGQRWPYVVAAVGSLLGVAGYISFPAETAPVWAGMIGAASTLAFILNLGLPALLEPSEVARASGFMFTIGYGTAFFGPALGGVLWDLSGHSTQGYPAALVPMGLAAVGMLLLGVTLPSMARIAARRATSAAGS